MTQFCSCGLALFALVSSPLCGQQISFPPPVVRTNQEVRVSGLPSLKARTGDAPDVLATSLAIVFRDKDVCCERNSALDDRLPQSDPVSLNEVASKVQGRQLLSDGRPILISAEYSEHASINSGQLINAILAKHPALMVWNSRLYVVYGVIFDESVDNARGGIIYVIRKLLLLDARYSDSRREITFNRDTDDLTKVQGFLFLSVAPE